MPCYSPLEGYKDIRTGGLTFKKTGTAQSLTVSCGGCLGCRLDHALMWSLRIVHESTLYQDTNGNAFVTLTYRDIGECDIDQRERGHYIPANYSLVPDHVTKFIKRLRRQHTQKIKYFYCGEYGDENQRPHYHLCLFNVSFPDKQLFKDVGGIQTYSSPNLEKLWPYGFNTVQALCPETASYVSRYSLKKVTGKRAKEHYLRCDEHGEAYWLTPEFIRMSTGNQKNKRQGIGADFYEKYKSDIWPSDEVPVPGKGIVKKVPRYYQNILQSEDPDTLDLVKDLREIFFQKHKHDYTPERLKDKYIVAQANLKRQKREL